MKLCIEIPDDVVGDDWIQELVNEGSDMCWHSDQVDGLQMSIAVVEGIAGILEKNIPEADQQAFFDAKVERGMM